MTHMEISVHMEKVAKKDAGCSNTGGSLWMEQAGRAEGKTKERCLKGTLHIHCGLKLLSTSFKTCLRSKRSFVFQVHELKLNFYMDFQSKALLSSRGLFIFLLKTTSLKGLHFFLHGFHFLILSFYWTVTTLITFLGSAFKCPWAQLKFLSLMFQNKLQSYFLPRRQLS